METKQKIYERSFENFDEKSFKNDIDKLNLNKKIESFTDINTKYKSFHENIMPVINKHAPFKELSNREIKKLKKPWVTKGIAIAINKRNSFLKKKFKTKDQFWFIRYKNHRAKINHLLRKNKKNYYNQLFSKTNK